MWCDRKDVLTLSACWMKRFVAYFLPCGLSYTTDYPMLFPSMEFTLHDCMFLVCDSFTLLSGNLLCANYTDWYLRILHSLFISTHLLKGDVRPVLIWLGIICSEIHTTWYLDSGLFSVGNWGRWLCRFLFLLNPGSEISQSRVRECSAFLGNCLLKFDYIYQFSFWNVSSSGLNFRVYINHGTYGYIVDV